MIFGGVKVFNKKYRTRYYRFGGKVKAHHKMTRQQLENDSVKAILQPNEIVIPVKYADRVAKMLKKANIKLPNL